MVLFAPPYSRIYTFDEYAYSLEQEFEPDPDRSSELQFGIDTVIAKGLR